METENVITLERRTIFPHCVLVQRIKQNIIFETVRIRMKMI